MEGQDRRTLAAAAAGAAVGAGAAAALLARRAVSGESGIVTLDEAAMALLQAIDESIASTNALLQQILDQPGTGGTGGASGNFGVNQPYMKATRFVCAVANLNYQLPSIPVPEGMQLLLRGWWGNGGVIYVTADSANINNINNSYPLLANEVLGLRVRNADSIYVAATVPAESVVLVVEYESK